MINPAGITWAFIMYMFIHPVEDITPEEECMLVCSPSSYELIYDQTDSCFTRLCICGNDNL